MRTLTSACSLRGIVRQQTFHAAQHYLRLSHSLVVAGWLAYAPIGPLQAQGPPRGSLSEYVTATWDSLFALDPEAALSDASRVCVESQGLVIGDPDPRPITSMRDQDTTTVPYLEARGQYVVDAADCWSAAPDTTFPTLYVQGAITRRRASSGDSVTLAVFKLFKARSCPTDVLRRCALPVKGATIIYVTGSVAKTRSGWPPLPLRRVYPEF